MVKRITSGAVAEYCAGCDTEAEFRWHTEIDGYKAFCPHCGSRLVLCNMCPRADTCGYDRDTDTCPMMFDGSLNRKQFIDYLDATFDMNAQTTQMVKNVLDIIQDDILTVDKKRSILTEMVDNIIPLTDREIRMLNFDSGFHVEERRASQWEAYLSYLRTWIADHAGSEFCGCSPVGYDEYIEYSDDEYTEE